MAQGVVDLLHHTALSVFASLVLSFRHATEGVLLLDENFWILDRDCGVLFHGEVRLVRDIFPEPCEHGLLLSRQVGLVENDAV